MHHQRGYGPLAAVLDEVAAGRFPPADGGVTPAGDAMEGRTGAGAPP